MRKKKLPQIVKVEKINELHTATNITNETTVNKELPKQALLLTTTKPKLDIIEEKNNKKTQKKIFNINNIEENIDIVNNIETKKNKKSKKNKKDNKDTIRLKNNILINKNYKYENLINYIKCNKMKIINILYEKKILKCKKIPLLLLLNLYTNYNKNDIEIIKL